MPGTVYHLSATVASTGLVEVAVSRAGVVLASGAHDFGSALVLGGAGALVGR